MTVWKLSEKHMWSISLMTAASSIDSVTWQPLIHIFDQFSLLFSLKPPETATILSNMSTWGTYGWPWRKLRCWAGLYINTGGCSQIWVFYACDNTNGRLVYVVLGGDYMQEDSLPVRSCYHTHGKLISNWWLMHPHTYSIASTTSPMSVCRESQLIIEQLYNLQAK